MSSHQPPPYMEPFPPSNHKSRINPHIHERLNSSYPLQLANPSRLNMGGSPRVRKQSQPTGSDLYLPDSSSPLSTWSQSASSNSDSHPNSSPQSVRKQSHTSNDPHLPESPPQQARKRSRQIDGDSYLPASISHSAKRSKANPLRNHESPPLRAPMPQHPQIASILRTNSPFAAHQPQTSSQKLVATPTPLPRHHAQSLQPIGYPTATPHYPNHPLSHTYQPLRLLDPASLSPEPDPVAIAAIKQILGPTNDGKTLGQMFAALEAHGRSGSNSAYIPAQYQGQTLEARQGMRNVVAGNAPGTMAGADFDALLDDYSADSDERGDAKDDPEEEQR